MSMRGEAAGSFMMTGLARWDSHVCRTESRLAQRSYKALTSRRETIGATEFVQNRLVSGRQYYKRATAGDPRRLNGRLADTPSTFVQPNQQLGYLYLGLVDIQRSIPVQHDQTA
jgi:hypothetical protein